MNKFIISIIAFLLSALGIAVSLINCTKPVDNKIPMGYDIIVIDSCEYLYGNHKITHKGNCKYCEQRRKEKLEYVLNGRYRFIKNE